MDAAALRVSANFSSMLYDVDLSIITIISRMNVELASWTFFGCQNILNITNFLFLFLFNL